MQTPQADGQDFNASSLVDEINGARLERQGLLGRESIPGKEHHWQGHTAAPQLDEQLEARDAWKLPVEQDDISLTGDG